MARSVLTQLDLNSIPLLNIVVEPVSTLPATATAGRLVMLASTSKVYVGNGTAWKEFGEAGALPAIAISDVDDLQAQLDLKATVVALNALSTTVGGKANASHSHAISEITDLASQLAALNTAIGGKANTSHTHIASAITDFATAVDARIVAYIDSVAGTDENLDTLREIIDMVKSNATALEAMIGRFSADVGTGSQTSIAITHGLNSRDCSVEVYEKSTGATVLCDVIRTSVNVVTLGFATAPAANSLRVVIKV